MSVDVSGDASDVWEEDVRRARKARRCNACGEPIRPGDLYHVTRSLYDGSWETICRCARCEAMYRFLTSLMPRGEVCDEHLACGHDWNQRWGGEAPPFIQLLAFLTPSEAQRLLKTPRAVPPPGFAGPRETPEAWIARSLQELT